MASIIWIASSPEINSSIRAEIRHDLHSFAASSTESGCPSRCSDVSEIAQLLQTKDLSRRSRKRDLDRRSAVVGVDDSVSRQSLRVDFDEMPSVSVVGTGSLEPLGAFRATDEHRLAVSQLMELLEEVDAPQGNPLCGPAVVAGEGYFFKPGKHQVTQVPVATPGGLGLSGCQRHRSIQRWSRGTQRSLPRSSWGFGRNGRAEDRFPVGRVGVLATAATSWPKEPLPAFPESPVVAPMRPLPEAGSGPSSGLRKFPRSGPF